MQNLVIAAADRFDDLVLGITAGLDSRLVFAAAKNLSNKIGYVTVRQGNMPDSHPDLGVPAALLGKLNLPHNIVHARPSMSPGFSELFKENIFLAHDHYGPDAEAILNSYNRRKAVITGSGAEVGRCPYRQKLLEVTGNSSSELEITAEILAALDNKAGSEYAITHFREWLADAQVRHSVHILDLFSWENGHGNWLAMTQLEFDIAWREILTPYNCRSVLTTMLAVDETYRCYPEYRLAIALIGKMWPEALSEPINPGTGRGGGLLGRIKRAVKRHISVPR